MKLKAVIILLALGLSIVLPPSLALMTDRGGQATIGTLDVCHAAAPALSSSGEMPCVIECTCHPLYLTLNTTAESINSPFKPLLFAFQDERPPKS
jgi:hypothetical protein